jgi:multidrug efflux pump subunit AcrB
MSALSAWFTKNPVAANLVMFLILIFGFFTLKTMRIEGFPAIPSSTITITTFYPGANAKQVDEGVTRKIEKALEGMPGLKKISSFSSKDYSEVSAEKISKYDMDRFQNDISSRVESIFNLPGMAERPVVSRDDYSIEALLVQVYGETDSKTLQDVSQQVRERLISDPEISKLDLFGLYDKELVIQPNLMKMEALNLSISDISYAIQENSSDNKSGMLKSKSGTILVKTVKKAENIKEFRNLPIITTQQGTTIYLHEIAEVNEEFQDLEYVSRFQGKPAVGIQIFTGKKGHLLKISDAANKIIEEMKRELPENIEIRIWGDYSVYMRDRLALLGENAWQGLLIVFVLLAIFLEFKLAFWVAMGVPISIAGTLAIMGDRFLGYSLNDITTFGMIIVLGILVDDAIVVGESVYDEQKKNSDAIQATIKGVHKVSTATVFGCFTTIAAFYPLLMINNDLGKVFASFAVVVIVSLLVSLFESKFILPAHLAAIKFSNTKPRNFITKNWKKIQDFAKDLLTYVNEKVYTPLLTFCLKFKYSVIMVFLTIAFIGVSLIFNGWIRTVFFPEVPGQIITVSIEMKQGSSISQLIDNIDLVEEKANEINQHYMTENNTEEPVIVNLMSAVTGDNSAMIFAELQPEEKRKMETMETLRQWRDKVSIRNNVRSMNFSGSEDTGGGFALNVSAGNNALTESAAKDVVKYLKTIGGIYNVRTNVKSGQTQVDLKLKPKADYIGISKDNLYSQISDYFGGREIQRLQQDTEEVKVRVILPNHNRSYLKDLTEIKIKLDNGNWIPLSSIADFVTSFAPAGIYRKNSQRIVSVYATLDKEKISATEVMTLVNQNLTKDLESKYKGLKIAGAGELEEISELKTELIFALIAIIILIYTFLAIPLKSYTHPLVIMSVIPFGIVGASIGHLIMNKPLSLLSFFGMMAVMGIVVNDSLVMLSRFTELREEGLNYKEALIQAGSSRFRAILLTTLTTVCGLLPLLTETSEQAQYLIPAAISLAFGELFATPITLFIVPVLIDISNDVKKSVRSFFSFKYSRVH